MPRDVCYCGTDEMVSRVSGGRRKRAPSKYNIYMKECLAREKGNRPHTENFKFCATQWKSR